MNRPFRHPIAVSPASPVGLAATPKVTCSACNGSGEAYHMALDSTRWVLGDCNHCDGEGKVEARCDTCSRKLTAAGFCLSCEDYGLVPVERIAPGRIAA